MSREAMFSTNIREAMQRVVPYLEETSNTTHKAIYFDGWHGIAASAVLRDIAEEPPPCLLRKFNKVIHIDCSKWNSRRELQRIIAQELKLSHRVMAIFDKQAEEDDFQGVDESSRGEIQEVAAEIHQALRECRCLVVFHNTGYNTIGSNDFGIPQPLIDLWFVFNSNVLWEFHGRLRINSEIPEQGGNIMDYNWDTHASGYWVCDGIIHGGYPDENESWEVAATLYHHIHIDDYSFHELPKFGDKLKTPKRWILARENSIVQGRKDTDTEIVHPESTSFFLATAASGSDPSLWLLPNDMFHQSDKLHVLKLYRCTFNFSVPPFHCCHNLRFLGLDGCKDQKLKEDEKKDKPSMDFFQSLWVLDVCEMDWELPLTPEIIEQMAANIREVHIKNGRIWKHSFAWRQLYNLQKLRVIEPTSPSETREMDDFTDMVKLEFLNLSVDSAIQVLPGLSGTTSLKTLSLDGCVGLDHIGPEGLPPSLESFSLKACTKENWNKKAKISRISLVGCASLVNFRLCGSFPNLEELDLSGTLIKTLYLKDQMVQAPSLQEITLLGCLQLRAIMWPEKGLPKLTLLHIDSLVCCVNTELHQAYATISDIRFLQTLVLESNGDFCWKSTRFHLNFKVQGQSYKKEKTGPGSSGQIMDPRRRKSLIPNAYNTYKDVVVDNLMTFGHVYNSALESQQSGFHVEIGHGISNMSIKSILGMKAIICVMDKAQSLHVHDNSSITTVIPEHMMSLDGKQLRWRQLKQCFVVRCPMIDTVFTTSCNICCFDELVDFWAADLLMVHCIWSKGRTVHDTSHISFNKLRSIHIYSCPRLLYVLPLRWFHTLSNLQTLHIINCGDLNVLFPMELNSPTEIAMDNREGVVVFPELKHIYLHELPSLRYICESKISAPKLKTMKLRGCWSLRRLPNFGRDIPPAVDCEKDWWDNLEWDRREANHGPWLFNTCHPWSSKKPRTEFISVLR